jgi:hypothetical protein
MGATQFQLLLIGYLTHNGDGLGEETSTGGYGEIKAPQTKRKASYSATWDKLS